MNFMGSPDSAFFTPNISGNCCLYYCSPCCPGPCFPFSPPPPFELGNRDSDPTFSPLVIAIIGILASAFLLVFYYAILAKYCTSWDSFRSRMRGGGYNDSYEDEDHNLTPSNDSWPLVTVGLEESTIRSIPVYKYKRGDGLVDCTDCSVCLSEFHEDDSVRLLPKCNHAFHVPCIDTWLNSHSNCPLCRANIVSPAASLPVEVAITIHDEGSDTTAVTQIWCGLGDWRFPYNLDIGCRAHFVSSFFACLRPNSRGSLCWALRCIGTIGLVLACYYRLWVIHLAKAILDK